MKKKLIMLIATGLGTGYFPVSGTVATALAIVLYLPASLLNRHSALPLALYGALCLGLLGLSIWTAGVAEKVLGEKDPHKVVIDEIAGFFFAMFFLPTSILSLFLAFSLFRLFDIWKPWPINVSQNLPSGLGITIDDILAGIYTCVILNVAFHFFL